MTTNELLSLPLPLPIPLPPFHSPLQITEPLVTLKGHTKKVVLLHYHPTASNLLSSASADQTVRLWDVERGCQTVALLDGHKEIIQDFAWDYCGNQFATSSRDKVC
jgi:coronin-1B/1C/6